MSAVVEPNILATIEALVLNQHIDLSINESCELVAQIIDGAPNLEKIFIGQKSER